jgi:tubulin-specific chaperone A
MSSRSKAATDTSVGKKLKVQIGVVKRMVKEVASYEKEVLTNEARVQKMRDDGKDIYDIRKQEEVLQESYMMVPDSKARCEAAVAELAAILEEAANDQEADAALVKEAKDLVEADRLKQEAA